MDDKNKQYDIDDELMDELGGAMDDFDAKKFMPVVQVTVAINKGEKEPEKEDDATPSPEEMEELEKAMG
jgi:hypothetical protein